MQEYQIIEFSQEGIPRISGEEDLYNTEDIGSVFVHITLLL
jgi:hypothetical protein